MVLDGRLEDEENSTPSGFSLVPDGVMPSFFRSLLLAIAGSASRSDLRIQASEMDDRRFEVARCRSNMRVDVTNNVTCDRLFPR